MRIQSIEIINCKAFLGTCKTNVGGKNLFIYGENGRKKLTVLCSEGFSPFFPYINLADLENIFVATGKKTRLRSMLFSILIIMAKNLTLIGVLCLQYFENRAIAPCKPTNEYFQYLFEPWNCSRTKPVHHHQSPPAFMYATGPRRLYFTRSFRSIGLSFRPNWLAMTSIYQPTSQKNLTSI